MIFLDSSALVKRYVDEAGSAWVAQLMAQDTEWAASDLAHSETRIALCRRGPEGSPGSRSQGKLVRDWSHFVTVAVDADCLAQAAELGCRLQLRTLDAIHLAAARRLPSDVEFVIRRSQKTSTP